MNAKQLAEFHKMTDDLDIPKSVSATGGILLGSDYHFDLTRPGVDYMAASPFEQARAVAKVNIPIIQTREVDVGETVGYSNTWRAPTPRRIATVSAGYADGIIRAMGGKTAFMQVTCPAPLLGAFRWI